MGKKGKTEVGNAGDRGVKKNSTLWQNMAIFVWDSFQLLSQLAPDTRPSRLLKMIYNAKRSWDKQIESVSVRPNQIVTVRIQLIT